MYNAYLPRDLPYEKIPEDTPPGSGSSHSSDAFTARLGDAVSGVWEKLGLKGTDSGDLILLLLLLLLLTEKEDRDPITLLCLAAAFFL